MAAEPKKRITRSAVDPRVNLALSPELFDYVRTMAGIRGESITAFLNEIVALSMEKNAAAYMAAKELALKTKLE